MPSALFRRHDAASQAKYQEIKQLARTQRRVLAGSPGTLKQRTQSGHQYWVREHLRVDGRKADEYLGPARSADPAAVERLAGEIRLAKALAAGSAQLRLLGFQRIDRKPAAVLAAFFNRKLFSGGLVLVGSHAYGVLLNELGILSASYRTQDIDLARGQRLEVATPGEDSLQAILKESGLPFIPVPGMPSHRPSASFKLPGAETLAVDLLVPQTNVLLDFLIEAPIEVVCLSPNQVVPVLVPAPERLALHKLYASQSRRAGDRDKARKDLAQAAVLAAATEEETPGRLIDTFRAMPASGRTATRRGATAAARLLDAFPEAKDALEEISGRSR